MKKFFNTFFIVIFCFFVQTQLFAQDLETVYFDSENNILYGESVKKRIYSLDNYSEDMRASSANIDIITREDIEKQNTPSFSDLLNQIGSVTTQNSNGSDGSVTSVRIRGTDRVRMTIDGIRADRPSMTTPGVQSQFLLMDDIDFIEVLKGPQGNVSGTNASGGLISLRTRRGKGPMKIELGSDFGNYGSFKERFAVMGGNDKSDYYISTTWYKTDGGMRTTSLGTIKNDDYNNLSVVSNLGLKLFDDKAEIRDIFRYSRARKGIGIGSDPITYSPYQDPNNYSLNTDIMNCLSFTHSPKEQYDYDIKFGLYHNIYNDYGLTDEVNPYEESHTRMSSARLNLITQHNLKYKDWNTLSLGYNLETEFIDTISKSTSFGLYNESNYSGNTIQNDVFVNDVVSIKDILFLRGGARLINNSAYGTYITPNVSAALVLPTFKLQGATTKFRGSWGYSVNTPTLYQRYGIVNAGWMTWLANPNLKAEKMSSWDVGIEQVFLNDKLKFEFGYFDSKYSDYISAHYEYDAYWNMTGYYTNIGSARLKGYEAKATWEPNKYFKAVLNYTYTDAIDEGTGFDLPATPKNRINGLIYLTPHERWNIYFGLEASSSRTMSSENNMRVPGYIDAKIGTSVKVLSYKGLEVFLRANIYNLFNQNICMYRSGNEYYYSPRLRFMGGIFLQYNLPTKERV